MNFIKIRDHKDLAVAAEAASQALVNRIIYSWQEDLWLRRKWSLTEQDTKELCMKEICFEINDEQIELLQPVMEEEPKCKVTFGQGNLETLSLVFKFKLTDMKVTGTMRSYSSSKPCKSLPYQLLLNDVEFEILAGLLIRGDSFHTENFSHDYTNFNVAFSYKNKDESKDIFPLDKIQDPALRKSIEKYIVDKLCKDIIIAVEDSVGEECADTSVSTMLDNDYSYRNMLRLHKKKMTTAFQKFIDEMIGMINNDLKNKKLSEVVLPNLRGKLLKEDERGTFKATDGILKNLSSLQQYGYSTLHQDGDIILFIPLFFSYLGIVYKHLSINRKDEEQTRSFETPENSNSSYVKIKIHKENDEKITLTLLDYKVDDLGYIEIYWDAPLSNDPYKKSVEPEFALWLNYTLEYKVTPIIEERIKGCLNEALKDEKLISLLLHEDDIDVYDSDPLEVENDEEEDREDEKMEDDDHEKKNNGDKDDSSNHN